MAQIINTVLVYGIILKLVLTKKYYCRIFTESSKIKVATLFICAG
jgi:hypothetical protein